MIQFRFVDIVDCWYHPGRLTSLSCTLHTTTHTKTYDGWKLKPVLWGEIVRSDSLCDGWAELCQAQVWLGFILRGFVSTIFSTVNFWPNICRLQLLNKSLSLRKVCGGGGVEWLFRPILGSALVKLNKKQCWSNWNVRYVLRGVNCSVSKANDVRANVSIFFLNLWEVYISYFEY